MTDGQLIKQVHTCLVGDKLAGQEGLIDIVYDVREEQGQLKKEFEKHTDKVCVMQNQINTLMQDREKRIEAERVKAASKMAMRKFLNTLTLGLIKLKTGI